VRPKIQQHIQRILVEKRLKSKFDIAEC